MKKARKLNESNLERRREEMKRKHEENLKRPSSASGENSKLSISLKKKA